MEDTINRKLTIDTLKTHFEYGERDDKYWQFWHGDTVLDVISSIPTSQPRWNELYETVPPKDGLYLVTVRIKCETADYVFVDVDTYRNGGFMTHSTDEDGVEAWMELPEPWRKGGEQDG